MQKFTTVTAESVAEYTEKRSRFIATVRPVKTEQEATEFLNEMRSKYWDARHNCYAFSIRENSLSRFSDDGEPHGTAGKPILDVIQGSGLKDIMIVVTRYFGGTLLGTGGLVRAYSKSAKDAISNAEICEMIPCTEYKTVCEYTDHQKLVYLIETSNGVINNTEFSDKITLFYAFKDEESELFLHKLSETFSAKLQAEENKKQIFPFII